jgi:hypothetical protein
MTEQVLTASDISTLQTLVTQDTQAGRVAYYEFLADRGYAYAELALGVVTDDGLAGITARDYAETVSQQAGITLTNADWDYISQSLMEADFLARQTAFDNNPGSPATLDWQDIQLYHNNVFAEVGLPPDAWTPNIILNHGDDPEAAWQNLIDNGGISPLNDYREFLNDLDAIAAQERIDFADQLFVSVNGTMVPNSDTFGNSGWMRDNMPASYQLQTLWSGPLITSVLDEWIAGGLVETGSQALEAISNFLSDARSSLSDWTTDIMNVNDASLVGYANVLAQQWFGTTTSGTEDMATSTVPFSQLSATLDFVGSIYLRCEPTFIQLEGNPLVTRHLDGQGNTYFTAWYEGDSDDPGDLGEIVFVDAEEFIETTNSAFFVVYDPLVLDLDGDGVETTTHEDNHGSNFDLLEDNGLYGQHGWVGQDDGLLALDENGNGAVDGIGELFGDAQTSGFVELAQHDDNSDGVIDSSDAVYSDLFVWRDQNSDGISQAEEMLTLEQLEIASIDVHGTSLHEENNGNLVTQEGSFQFADGTEHMIADVNFTVDVISLLSQDEFIFG